MLKRVVVTGAGGQIAYHLLFRIASGELLGQEQPIALHLLETEEGMEPLKGVLYELDDCCTTFPLLQEVHVGTDPRKLFKDADLCILIGAKPRKRGMERRDLLLENAPIFKEQGRALNEGAKKEVVVLVVGNPCNTNCLIALKNAPRLDARRFFAMTQLDQNRFAVQLSKKAHVPLGAVSRAITWGNHSAAQVPDFVNALIEGRPALDTIVDRKWCEQELVPALQQRGAEVIRARGKSSAASAAMAIVHSFRNLLKPSKPSELFSCGVLSDGNPYGIEKGLVFSFPCLSKGDGEVEIAQGLSIDPFIAKGLKASEQELLEERAVAERYYK